MHVKKVALRPAFPCRDTRFELGLIACCGFRDLNYGTEPQAARHGPAETAAGTLIRRVARSARGHPGGSDSQTSLFKIAEQNFLPAALPPAAMATGCSARCPQNTAASASCALRASARVQWSTIAVQQSRHWPIQTAIGRIPKTMSILRVRFRTGPLTSQTVDTVFPLPSAPAGGASFQRLRHSSGAGFAISRACSRRSFRDGAAMRGPTSAGQLLCRPSDRYKEAIGCRFRHERDQLASRRTTVSRPKRKLSLDPGSHSSRVIDRIGTGHLATVPAASSIRSRTLIFGRARISLASWLRA